MKIKLHRKNARLIISKHQTADGLSVMGIDIIGIKLRILFFFGKVNLSKLNFQIKCHFEHVYRSKNTQRFIYIQQKRPSRRWVLLNSYSESDKCNLN